MDWSRVVGIEYQVLMLAAGPLTTLLVGWGVRQLAGHLRDRQVAAYVTRLVSWAEQAIPEKSTRYHEVAALLSRRFPMLSGEQMEVLIESEVHALKVATNELSAVSSQPSAGVMAES